MCLFAATVASDAELAAAVSPATVVQVNAALAEIDAAFNADGIAGPLAAPAAWAAAAVALPAAVHVVESDPVQRVEALVFNRVPSLRSTMGSALPVAVVPECRSID